jgi:hypothetical protein
VINSRCVVFTNSEKLQKQGSICFKAAIEKLNSFDLASDF